MGATDVCPFVPIAGVTMDDCVELARTLGQRVGEELGIPVYLYEKAATRPERENLATVRKGQYEGLRDEIKSNPARAPDFGPAELGAAGAVAIGARPFLIAYNVYLTTDDVEVAKAIARAVRHSSGGLRFVKGMGLLVEGRAQVSMNLTDYTRTPVARVQEMIRRGFLQLKRRPMQAISREETLERYKDLPGGRFFRVISVSSELGSHTVVLSDLLSDQPAAYKFVEVEKWAASALSRMSILVDTGLHKNR